MKLSVAGKTLNVIKMGSNKGDEKCLLPNSPLKCKHKCQSFELNAHYSYFKGCVNFLNLFSANVMAARKRQKAVQGNSWLYVS